MAPLVSLHNVIKRYVRGKQTIEVLHQLDLDVPAGQFLALMGPSGSGKTTLLNLIGGLDRPTAGEVIVAGERIDHLSSGQLAKWRARPRAAGHCRDSVHFWRQHELRSE